jgi:putative ABC transport system permease protein
MLTALGIIFGVAAVISMMAIGSGAKKEILDQIKLVGVNNIIIKPKSESDSKKGGNTEKDSQEGQSQVKAKYSPGLTLKDAYAIKSIIPTVSKVSPQVEYKTYIIKDGVRSPAKLSGVTPDFFEVFNLQLSHGLMFTNEQLKMGKSVCIIGGLVKTRIFKQQDPIGQYIKCGNIWLMVIGVLENRNVTKNATENLDISDYNNMIYSPIQTLLLRFKNRSHISADQFSNGEESDFSETEVYENGEESVGTNEIDKIIVQVKQSNQMDGTTQLLKRMVQRRHNGMEDFEIKVPEQLLKQEQRTKDIFNIVLGVIAGISLLVGGIGIMNIMLASVMERTKEIGIRMAIGATRKDIVTQFLMESTIISLSGGITGIILGIILSQLIMQVTGILTIVSMVSIIISFGVAATVGISFGYMPAKRAAMADPVVSLRYE